jgi:hypothetical protein
MKKISSKHFATDWDNDLSDRNSSKWVKGVEIISNRFQTRYFKPIDQLINSSDKIIKYNCGFLVMSIDCLIIETLNQFYFGVKKTTDKYYRTNSDINYKWNWQAFRDFFSHSTYFPTFKGNDVLIQLFFDEIRCGLLHQAESKTNSLINVRLPQMVTFIDATEIKKGIILNRNLFHKALVNEFDKYLVDLETPDSKNIFGEHLRDKCNEKMVELCR